MMPTKSSHTHTHICIYKLNLFQILVQLIMNLKNWFVNAEVAKKKRKKAKKNVNNKIKRDFSIM